MGRTSPCSPASAGTRWCARPERSPNALATCPPTSARFTHALPYIRNRSRPHSKLMDATRARKLLAAERARIERELAEHMHADEANAPEAEEFDAANLAVELFADEFAQTRVEDLRDQLAAVERAEQRLLEGTYGLSIESGEPIPDERLEALPTAELTAAEQRSRRVP